MPEEQMDKLPQTQGQFGYGTMQSQSQQQQQFKLPQNYQYTLTPPPLTGQIDSDKTAKVLATRCPNDIMPPEVRERFEPIKTYGNHLKPVDMAPETLQEISAPVYDFNAVMPTEVRKRFDVLKNF